MTASLDRRSFLETSAAAGAAWAVGSYFVSEARAQEPKSANEALTVCVMGVNGRGGGLIKSFMAQPNVQIAYVCDVAETAMARAVKVVGDGQERKPEGVKDFRKALEDKSLDILVCAAPNHWHAPATILGCSAGKHVYVEKPCSHNPREGELAVEAARKNKRVVQMGSQRRSRPGIIKGIEAIHNGAIGRVMFARTWYTNKRPSIGHAKPAEVPSWLDWTLWQGPAPERPYLNNETNNAIVHYNWHWRWHWGNGELGNNGVHALDVARWGLGVDTHPTKVSALGGKFYFDDDSEFPDTQQVTFEYAAEGKSAKKKLLIYEQRLWSTNFPHNCDSGAEFYGDKGQMFLSRRGKIEVRGDRNAAVEVSIKLERQDDAAHVKNFCDSVRGIGKLNADALTGHLSTALCHLGNIATRLGRSLEFDPKMEQIVGDNEANALVRREYREHWGTPKGA